MAENDLLCRKCGRVKRYINSNTKIGLFLNAVVMSYKQAGFLHTALYLVSRLLNTILMFPYRLKEWLHINRMIKAGKQMEPPWIAFPTIPGGSIGWRMGGGESYIMTWDKWYRRITKEEQAKYQTDFPEPPMWEGFYESSDS